MKHLTQFTCFLYIFIQGFAHGQDYILSKGSTALPKDLNEIVNEQLSSSNGLHISFFYGTNYEHAVFLKFNDSISATRIDLKKDSIITQRDLTFSDDSIYQYLKGIENEYFSLFSEHKSSISNGYLYRVHIKGELTASYYSHHAIHYYDLNDSDKLSLQTLYVLLKLLELDVNGR